MSPASAPGKRPREDSQVILVLAAGASLRYQGDKRQALMQPGRTLLGTSLSCFLGRHWPLQVVLRSGENELANDIQVELRAHGECDVEHLNWIFSEDAHMGMGHSLAAGVRANPCCTRLLVALADMPYLSRSTVSMLISAADAASTSAPGAIFRPRFAGRAGQPVAFVGPIIGALRRCTGDSGAREVIAQHQQLLHWMDVDDPGVIRDVDHPGDLTLQAADQTDGMRDVEPD